MPGREERQQAGILRPDAADRHIEVGRRDVAGPLAAYVDYAWWVTWRVEGTHRQEVIPRPVVHLAAEWRDDVPRLLVHGVPRAGFVRELEGLGRTVALAFRPGGLRPYLAGDAARAGVAALRGRETPAEELLGLDDRPVAAVLVDPTKDPEEGAGLLERWLARLDPPRDPLVGELSALVERAETDPTITRADQLAALAGVGVRTLQRQFAAYVGASPKWVVRRCRLLDVAAAAHGADPVDWAELAASLGYADQSHLIRGFTALVGHPPAAYVAGPR